MRLVTVTKLDGSNANLLNKVQSILNKEYDSKFDIHREFRKIVPKGRYALTIAKDSVCYMWDTQLLEKSN